MPGHDALAPHLLFNKREAELLSTNRRIAGIIAPGACLCFVHDAVLRKMTS